MYLIELTPESYSLIESVVLMVVVTVTTWASLLAKETEIRLNELSFDSLKHLM